MTQAADDEVVAPRLMSDEMEPTRFVCPHPLRAADEATRFTWAPWRISCLTSRQFNLHVGNRFAAMINDSSEHFAPSPSEDEVQLALPVPRKSGVYGVHD